MLTVSENPANPYGYTSFTARVRLSSGEIAGEGYGPNPETAMYYAVYDAMRSPNERYATAGRGHRVFLNAKDKALLENFKPTTALKEAA